jgi:hypothetical protein
MMKQLAIFIVPRLGDFAALKVKEARTPAMWPSRDCLMSPGVCQQTSKPRGAG